MLDKSVRLVLHTRLPEERNPFMKIKNVYLVLIILLVTLFSVTGCGNKQEVPKDTVNVTENAEQTESKSETVVDGVASGIAVEDEDNETDSKKDIVIETVEAPSVAESTEGNSEEVISEDEPVKSTTQTEAAPTTPDATQETAEPTVPVNEEEKQVSEYDAYMNMNAEEQQAFIESFPSLEAFMNWFNKAQEEHNANEDSLIIDSGVIDLEELSKMGQ